jgi:hypothetical protein
MQNKIDFLNKNSTYNTYIQRKKQMSLSPKIEMSVVPESQLFDDDVKVDFESRKIEMTASIPINDDGSLDRSKMLKVMFVAKCIKEMQRIINSDAEDKDEQLKKLQAKIQSVSRESDEGIQE